MSKRHWTLNYYRAIKVMTRLAREDKEKNRCGSSTRLCGTKEPKEHSRTLLEVNIFQYTNVNVRPVIVQAC